MSFETQFKNEFLLPHISGKKCLEKSLITETYFSSHFYFNTQCKCYLKKMFSLCSNAVIFGDIFQNFQKFLSLDIALVSKLVCDFLWLKVFSNSANILSWNQSQIRASNLKWNPTRSSFISDIGWQKRYVVCTSSDIRGKMPWDKIVKHIKLIQKRHFSQSVMFPYTLGISLLI